MKIIKIKKCDAKLSDDVIKNVASYKSAVTKAIKELSEEFNKGFSGKDFNAGNVKVKATALMQLAKVISK